MGPYIDGAWLSAALDLPGQIRVPQIRAWVLEQRVLNRYPRRELPVTLQSTAYTWSQVRGFRRLYAQTRQARSRGLLED